MSYSFEPNGGLGPHGRSQAAARVALAVNGMGSFTRDLAERRDALRPRRPCRDGIQAG